ncbi:MAG: nuclear transport factor 2 family protein [Alphaproteobacteria bacterium]|nr:nuclear transport factor 2 family protein [Alphaproteobacteria bacterium]
MKKLKLILLFSLLIGLAPTAQADENTLRKLDAKFWQAFNACDLKDLKKYLADDVEFFHNKNDYSSSSDSVIKSMKDNLCASGQNILKREEVEQSLKYYPLKAYGALLMGQHRFYQKDRLVSTAAFSHIWRLSANGWHMTRVISYDHQEAKFNASSTAIKLSNNQLEEYAGKYKSTYSGLITITLIENELLIETTGVSGKLIPETINQFSRTCINK